MKALFFLNPTPDKNSFVMQEDKVAYFYDKLHYHPEIQLTLIVNAKGKRFVGGNVSSFQTGEIYILGPNLPHVFKCADEYYKKNKKLKAHGLSVYFQPNSFGAEFLNLPESKKLHKLFRDSANGLLFTGATRERAAGLMMEMKEKEGFEKLCLLLNLLRILSESRERKLISGVGYHAPIGDENNKRLNDIFHYLNNNFHNEIKLDKLSQIANMSPTALCRFFKQRTRKTVFRFLMEVRIEQASKLLTAGKMKITDIAYECGYNNISNFNRQFLLITKMTPRAYLLQLR